MSQMWSRCVPAPRRAVMCAVLLAAILSAVVSARAQPATTPQLYFVAIGDVPTGMMSALAAHFEKKFGASITVLSPLSFDRVTFDASRSQAVADKLIEAVRFRHATLARSPSTRVIAITPLDMYMEAMREQWSFAFSMRSRDGRVAVVSYARMDPVNLGAPRDDALLRSRLRKMLAKNIGIMYFGLRTSDNPGSALFRNVLGVDDLDRMTEEFDPR